MFDCDFFRYEKLADLFIEFMAVVINCGNQKNAFIRFYYCLNLNLNYCLNSYFSFPVNDGITGKFLDEKEVSSVA